MSGGGAGIRNAQWGDGWAPGSTPRRLQPGVATRIPKGAKLVLQVHYHKTGKVEEDRSQVALYFAKGKVSDPLYVAPVGNASFELKPGVAYQEVRASLVTPANVKVHAVFPHMHMLGREMKVTATLPDGTQVPMIWIRDWDFAWQTNYHYTKPQSFPKGTKVDVVAVYDNSEKNPRQPSHPPQTVRFGEQTTDEMCFAFISFTVDKSAASSSGTAASLPAAPKATL